MDKNQAENLVIDTLTKAFDKNQFLLFIKNLLNHLNDSQERNLRQTGPYIKKQFQDKVKSFERLGTYSDPLGQKLDILVIHLQREGTIERGRTSLRNFVADYLATGHGQGKDAVLAAFVSRDPNDWRFSYIKLEYSFEQSESGHVSERRELTPARRYSFLVGSNERSHTAQKQFLPLLENDQSDPSIKEIESAFDIEKVTDEFFERYKELFEKVRDTLKHALKLNALAKDDFEKKGIELDDFAKKLLGQIVFLYFLQKKGWFGVELGDKWGTGNKHFLRYLFDHREQLRTRQDRTARRPVNFFNDVLEHLFYDALAIEREDDYYSRFDCRIPFLNGGLFEPLFGYDWVKTEILLPDDLFSNDNPTNQGDTGSGILDVFDRYNFTVNESEPLEKEVAVDPEMLGKVFENLLPENLRHKDATYYTPRPVVHFMCQRSLINYLATSLPNVPVKDLEILILTGFARAEFQAAGTHQHRDKCLPDSIRDNAQRIDEYLENVSICDPAVGSGAFLVGMMQLIVSVRLALRHDVRDLTAQIIYDLKLHAIQNSLYGVDIDPGALEIAKLRLWLSLVVDEEDRERIQALPNLDYKLMQGNSLLDEFKGVKLLEDKIFEAPTNSVDAEKVALKQRIDELQKQLLELNKDAKSATDLKKRFGKLTGKLAKQHKEIGRGKVDQNQSLLPEDLYSEARKKLEILKQLHLEFFSEKAPKEKRKKRSEIEQVEWQFMEEALKERGEDAALQELAKHRRDNRRNYFLWKLHFVEVFQGKGGFDIVIANPPYGAEIEEEHKAVLKKRYSHITERIRNSFLYFMGAAYEISRELGVVCFIMPNEFLFQIYMTKARKFFLDNARYLFAINLGEDVFRAIVPTCVVAFQKVKSSSYAIPVGDFRNSTLEELEQKLATLSLPISSSEVINSTPNYIFTFDLEKTALVNRFANSFERFENYCEDIANGISTSCDSIYIVDEEATRKKSFEKTYVKPCIRGGQFNRYRCPSTTGDFILYVTSQFQPKKAKNILDYLSSHKALLIDKSVEKKNGIRDWHLLFRPRYEGLFKPPKIIFRQTADRIVAAIDETVGYYCIDSVNVAQLKSEHLHLRRFFLGVLNSTLVNFFYREISQEAGRVLAQVKPQRLRALPIPKATEEQQTLISTIVEYLIFLHSTNLRENSRDKLMVSYFEQLIDAMVYELFLSAEIYEAGKPFFSPLAQELLPLLDNMEGDRLLALRQIFDRLFDREHIVRQNIFFLDTLQTVRIIEGKG